jgi:hypothetical protein
MPDPKQSLQKSIEAQRKMREAAEQAKRQLEEERKRKEQQTRP